MKVTLIESFHRRWSEARRPEAQAALEPLLRRLYDAFMAPRTDHGELRDALIGLLELLTSPAGRTEANLGTVDAFVCLLTVERDDLLDRLPPAYQGVLDALGIELPASLREPDLAEAIGATPEMLLARARELPTVFH